MTTALAAAGLPPHPFRFIGFLPRTAAARRALLTSLAGDRATLVAFEAPRRLTDALRDAFSTLGDRPACLARNLTKRHERYQRATLSQLIAELEAEGEVRGEATILIGGATSAPTTTRRQRPMPGCARGRCTGTRRPIAAHRAARDVATRGLRPRAPSATRMTEPIVDQCSAPLATATSTARSSIGWPRKSCRGPGTSMTPSSA